MWSQLRCSHLWSCGARYGVTPGYGQTMQDGFEDIFTTTAAAALEWGAIPWAKGLIDNQFSFYVRDDGMINYRGEELAQSARMLTILALYFSYTGDSELLLNLAEPISDAAERSRCLLEVLRCLAELRWDERRPEARELVGCAARPV